MTEAYSSLYSQPPPCSLYDILYIFHPKAHVQESKFLCNLLRITLYAAGFKLQRTLLTYLCTGIADVAKNILERAAHWVDHFVWTMRLLKSLGKSRWNQSVVMFSWENKAVTAQCSLYCYSYVLDDVECHELPENYSPNSFAKERHCDNSISGIFVPLLMTNIPLNISQYKVASNDYSSVMKPVQSFYRSGVTALSQSSFTLLDFHTCVLTCS